MELGQQLTRTRRQGVGAPQPTPVPAYVFCGPGGNMSFGRRRIGSAHAIFNSHVGRASSSPVERAAAATAAVNLAAGRAACGMAARALGRARGGLDRVE